MTEKRFSNKKSSRKAYVARRLSPMQIHLLKKIANYMKENNYSPSYQCLAEMEKITPPSIFSRVNTLIKLGYIVKEPNGRGFHIARWDFLDDDSNNDSDKMTKSGKSSPEENSSIADKVEKSDPAFSEGKPAIQKAPHSNFPRPLGEVVSLPVTVHGK